ncbi:hypothetical protein Peur_012574 [Populus x canadensis]
MLGFLLFEEPLHYCHKLWALQVAAQLGHSGKPLELTFEVNSLHPFASAPLLITLIPSGTCILDVLVLVNL